MIENRICGLMRAVLVGLLICTIGSGCVRFSGSRVWRESGVVKNDELSVFDEAMRRFMVEKKISAGALAITYQGRLVLAKGYTWAGRDVEQVGPRSLFRIASVSKPVTAVAVLHLVEAGQLRLDEKVADVLDLSPAEGQTADPRLKDVTILHLLQHLGGWNCAKTLDPMYRSDDRISRALGVKRPIGTADIIKFMNGQPLQNDPGTTFVYSNYGYCLLGRVIERRSGMAYGDYVRKEILAPLGIRGMRLGRSRRSDRAEGEVVYESGILSGSPYGSFNLENSDADGGWLASAEDLVRFASAFDDAEDCAVLSPASIERMFTLPENIKSADYTPGDLYYACGWNVHDYGEGERTSYHAGGMPGTLTFMVRWRNGVNWVGLFNKRIKTCEQIDEMLRQAAQTISAWPQDKW